MRRILNTGALFLSLNLALLDTDIQRFTSFDAANPTQGSPLVNVFGFIHQDRYLPDGRDLNRCFPGSSSGSLASRLANLFMKQVVEPCSFGIDLHTGSRHRTNLPQIRTNLDE